MVILFFWCVYQIVIFLPQDVRKPEPESPRLLPPAGSVRNPIKIDEFDGDVDGGVIQHSVAGI